MTVAGGNAFQSLNSNTVLGKNDSRCWSVLECGTSLGRLVGVY